MQFSQSKHVSPFPPTCRLLVGDDENHALCSLLSISPPRLSAFPRSWGYNAGFQGFLLVPMDMNMDCGVLSSQRAFVPILSFPTV